MINRREARLAAAVLAVVVTISLSQFFTQEVSAASGSKGKYQLPVRITEKYIGENGVKTTTVHKFKYNKKGLLVSWWRSEGRKVTYTRNKKGGITRETLNNNGTVESYVSYRLNSKGLPVTGRDDTGGKFRFTYKKGKMYREKYEKDETTYFYPNGLIRKHKYDNGDVRQLEKYDRHGILIYSESNGFPTETYSLTYDNNLLVSEIKTIKEKGKKARTESAAHEYTFDDAGRITEKVSSAYYEGYKEIKTYNYVYNSNGSLIKTKVTGKTVYDDGSIENGSTYITTFKYKKFNVAKKYRKFVYDRLPHFEPDSADHYAIMPYGLRLELESEI